MNIEKDLQKDGIIVVEKLDTETILTIANNISQKIVHTFPNFNLNADEIFSRLCSLNMYKAQMPEGMAEANYCYRNSSIYFNYKISLEDLEEFAIHECLHFLQEKKDINNNIERMGFSIYSKFKTIGVGLNEAAVQYISAKIIGIQPDYEKYYDINIFTPSPSYYPVECALLNELIYFIGEDTLFQSAYFSNDDFKNKIIEYTSPKIFNQILTSFDDILKSEEVLINLNNKLLTTDNSKRIENNIIKYREKINSTFIQTQNLIIKNFFDFEYNNITNLEQLENYRRKLSKFKPLVRITDNYTFFDNYYLEMMNKLEHKLNVFENGGIETAINKKTPFIFNFFNKLKNLIFSKNVHED